MSSKPEILLVDDNIADLKLGLHALRQEDSALGIIVARDGEEALDVLLGRGKYQQSDVRQYLKLVLLDLKLPKVNGFDVLRVIKAHDAAKHIPVVVLTSSNQESDIQECYRLGANSYVQKPVDFDRYQQLMNLIKLYWTTANQGLTHRH
jgi:CheY-like chemotaxis protein